MQRLFTLLLITLASASEPSCESIAGSCLGTCPGGTVCGSSSHDTCECSTCYEGSKAFCSCAQLLAKGIIKSLKDCTQDDIVIACKDKTCINPTVVATAAEPHWLRTVPQCGPDKPCGPPPPGADPTKVSNKCVVSPPDGTQLSKCALVCDPSFGQKAGCPPGNNCAAIQGTGLCVPVKQSVRPPWNAYAPSHETETKPVDVFVSGQDGYSSYRIPSLIQVEGAMLLFAEGRKLSRSDHGWNDIVMKKSNDGGCTWGKMQKVYGESTTAKMVTIGNPSPIAVHTQPGMIMLVACRENKEVLQLLSYDAGVTWSNATYITAQAMQPDWTWIATGPPTGLQLKSGRLLIAADHMNNGGKNWGSHSMYSDDMGKSWQLSNTMNGAGGNECQAVVCANGSLIMNQRTRGGVRQFSWSHDNGTTWTEPLQSPFNGGQKYAGGSCEGSTVSLPAAGGVGDLVFSTPFSISARANMTLFKSTDSGASWQWLKQVDAGGSAYSSLMALNETHVALVYEAGDYSALRFVVVAVA